MTTGKPIPADAESQSGLAAGLAAGLYVTATPIGHSRDITLRALEVLKACDVIVVEDTRVTSKLLSLHGISKPLKSYNDHNATLERPRILARLREGARIALVSDAGTPLISDPGYKLVREATVEGIAVYAIPGACAALAALSVAGLPTDRFLFAGFPPARSGERRTFFGELKNIRATLVFYESAQRLTECLVDMSDILGLRPAVVARELTKLHEEIRRGTLAELAEAFPAAPKGEITIVVGAPAKPDPDYAQADRLLDSALAFMPVRAAADLVADALKMPRRETYERALSRKADAE